jgi:hypothetical protein
MKFLVIVLGLTAALAMAAIGACGPKQKYCPELGGPCFDNDAGPAQTGTGGDTGSDGSVIITGT